MIAVDPYVQDWVAATNGRLYRGLVGKLSRYPIPSWPGPPLKTRAGLLLDIGCGWGRWMVSSAAAGYTPIGIDVQLDALEAARRVLKANGRHGYVVAADLRKLPFKSNIFDLVFSYSVIQHTHRLRASSCVEEVHRILASDGLCMLQFALSHGLGNTLRRLPGRAEEDDYESWCVRYYSMGELKSLFCRVFDNCQFLTDCYFGIGVQPSDLDLLPSKYKAVVILSEALKSMSSLVTPLRLLADSIYVMAQKGKTEASDEKEQLPTARFRNNLDILEYIQCPVTGGELQLSPTGDECISITAGLAYPIVNEIPVLIPEQARSF
jgi:ubiquinone/menaquinone biosynthesis C-methylase UbiE/uncharacterized protein YbaR (Trm112 family)